MAQVNYEYIDNEARATKPLPPQKFLLHALSLSALVLNVLRKCLSVFPS